MGLLADLVEGSARLQLTDGTQTSIGYAGNTAYDYKSWQAIALVLQSVMVNYFICYSSPKIKLTSAYLMYGALADNAPSIINTVFLLLVYLHK